MIRNPDRTKNSVDAEIPTDQVAAVEEQHPRHRHAPQPVECGLVRDGRLGRNDRPFRGRVLRDGHCDFTDES